MSSSRPSRLDFGIGLISCAVLLIELLLTRIFSVTMFYHLSFMVVSLAMLGLGFSGLIVNLWPAYFRRDRLPLQLSLGSLLFALTSVLAIGIAFRVRVELELTTANWLRVGFIYLLCIIPFLAGGLVVALILTHHAAQANRLYFFDLTGAAAGCLIFVPATNWLGAPTAVLLGAAIATVAAIVLAGKSAPLLRQAATALCLVLLAAAIANTRWNFYDVRVVKGERQPPMLALKWNAFSRVDVKGSVEELWKPRHPVFAGFSTTLDPEFRIPELWLRYDADAATQITRFDGNPARLRHLRYDVSSAPHQMRQYHNVLIIGPGGGRDILTALHMGSGPVTGVEINPLTIQLMRKRFRTFTGGLYTGYPGVRVINDEGRSFVRHSNAQYDLIQASLVDTWAASAAGAYALTENSLHTVEAFEDFMRRLTPDGVIAFTRWFPDPPEQALRAVAIGVEAMRRQGVMNPAQHVFIVRTNPEDTKQPSLASLLFKRSPFTQDQLTRLRQWAEQMKFIVAYSPDDLERDVPPGDFHKLVSPLGESLIENHPSDISPVYDDRPFFFNQVPLFSWIAHRLGIATSRVGEGYLTLGAQTLLISLIVTAACTLLLLLLPLVAAKWGKSEDQAPSLGGVSRRRAVLWAIYFAGLGLGFILVEIVLIQRFSLFLGYPVYSLSVVLFTILLASGAGSYLAGRSRMQKLPVILAALCGALVLYALVLPSLLDAVPGASASWRIATAAIVTAPLGLLMGMPFPTGLRRAGAEASGLVSWAWAVNGAASVFGSTLAVLISMTWGFTTTFLTGAACYAVALGVAAMTAQPAEITESELITNAKPAAADPTEWLSEPALSKTGR
jgi:spermidine synthase